MIYTVAAGSLATQLLAFTNTNDSFHVNIWSLDKTLLKIALDILCEGCATDGTRAACGPPVGNVQPARVSFHLSKCVLTLSSSLRKAEYVEKNSRVVFTKYSLSIFSWVYGTPKNYLEHFEISVTP
jgi:hypothetical protein